MLIEKIASDAVLDEAYAWLCLRRKDYPDHADVWDFRRNWAREKERLRCDLGSGDYRFGLLARVETADGGTIDLWSARDALMLKALSRPTGLSRTAALGARRSEGPQSALSVKCCTCKWSLLPAYCVTPAPTQV
jgi:hypothetical protein